MPLSVTKNLDKLPPGIKFEFRSTKVGVVTRIVNRVVKTCTLCKKFTTIVYIDKYETSYAVSKCCYGPLRKERYTFKYEKTSPKV
jgi:hypothetical protein